VPELESESGVYFSGENAEQWWRRGIENACMDGAGEHQNRRWGWASEEGGSIKIGVGFGRGWEKRNFQIEVWGGGIELEERGGLIQTTDIRRHGHGGMDWVTQIDNNIWCAWNWGWNCLVGIEVGEQEFAVWGVGGKRGM